MAPSASRDRSANRRISAFFLSKAKASSSASNSDSDTDDRRGRSSPVNPHASLSLAKSPRRSHLAPPADTKDELQSFPPVATVSPDSRSESAAPASHPIQDLPVTRPRVPSISIPTASNHERGPATATDHAGKLRKRRNSWLRAAGSKDNIKERETKDPKAWVAGYDSKPAYSVDFLLQGQQVPELWDETGGQLDALSELIHLSRLNITDTFIYLFPKSWGRNASFKVRSETYASSTRLVNLARQDLQRSSRTAARLLGEDEQKPLNAATRDIRIGETPMTSPLSPASSDRLTSECSSVASSRHTRDADDFDTTSRPIHLHLPIHLSENAAADSSLLTDNDIETLLDMRNMFAFLVGQMLVATDQRQTIFALFLNISKILTVYDFTNIDGSTYGEVACNSFDKYIEELKMGDVRSSREKTIESLVLGERMRSVTLYNEAFVHAVGKYDDIQYVSKFEGPDVKFGMINPMTRSRLERASIDLSARENTINTRLIDFDFPSLFAGVLNSKTINERKVINFNAWQNSFNATRRYVLSYLKSKYGSWPPKASSKKNDLETSGLNRIVLKSLYFDFAELYDLYVDRTSLTSRTIDKMYEGPEAGQTPDEPAARILRRVFDEYDRSSPPVQPPVPFDLPILPSVSNLSTDFKVAKTTHSEARKLRMRKLSPAELDMVLGTSVNPDALPKATTDKSHFLAAMRSFEAKQARGSSIAELSDLRAGIWLFLYAVLQTLPLLVTDAPGVKWHQGVEYFLCAPARSGLPWVRPGSTKTGRGWYSVSGGANVVELPSDLIEHGVEGIYRRSHCWLVADRWAADLLPSIVSSAKYARSNSEYTLEQERKESVDVRRRDTQRLAPPRPSGVSDNGSRPPTPLSRPSSGQHLNRQSVMGIGLEALPLPSGIAPAAAGSRPGSRAVSASGYGRVPLPDVTAQSGPAPIESERRSIQANGMTFDDILGSIEKEKKKEGKK